MQHELEHQRDNGSVGFSGLAANGRARLARGIALAVTPTFALMAWISLPDAAHAAMGHQNQAMSLMYLLMAIAHAPAWLAGPRSA